MKALEKDRTRRYETANGLARDVQRYLADEPVQACPPSARLPAAEVRPPAPGGRWRRRRRSWHWSLVAGTAVSTWQAVRAHAGRQRPDAGGGVAAGRRLPGPRPVRVRPPRRRPTGQPERARSPRRRGRGPLRAFRRPTPASTPSVRMALAPGVRFVWDFDSARSRAPPARRRLREQLTSARAPEIPRCPGAQARALE